MALIPSTTTPVAINNVNNGTICPTTGPCVNCTYYIDNCTGTTVEYDGFTKPIPVTLNVSPCATYHFKLAIADAGDMAYDSGVFFAMQSLACNPPPIGLTTTMTPAPCTSSSGTASVSVVGGVPPYTYSWNTTPPQTSPTATGLAPGTYIVTVYDATGCFYNKDTIVIPNTGGFTSTSTQVNATCFGGNNASATVNPTGGATPYTYAWSTNPIQTTPTIAGVPAGNYTCLITDATGCTSTVTFTITQPPAVTGSILSSVNVSCFGGNNGSATATGSGGTGTITYSWSTSPPQTGITATSLIAGTYVVTIKDANGCSITQTVTITQPTGMTINTSSTPASCGVKDGTASVTSSGGALPYTYLWLTNPVQATPTATGLGAGSYIIIITDANGCTQQQSISVTGGMMPIADFHFLPEEVSLLDPIVAFVDLSAGNPVIWSWTFGDTASGANNISPLQNPYHTYSDTGTFCITLVISDASGICKDTVVKCLKVEAPYTFYIPNAFTPNSDSWNEMFLGYGTNIKDFHIMIFDRWGNKIFESHDITKGWNGKVKATSGQLVQEDVYVWKVEILDIYNKQHKYIGHLTMVK
jgi:gliding motility-associated-like protein